MKIMRSLLGWIVALGICTQSCKKPWAGEQYFWKLQNNSDRTISFIVSLKREYVQLSTDWPEVVPCFMDVKSGKSSKYTVEAKSFAYPLERIRDSFAVYVFDPDTVAKYTLEELKRDSNYLKRYLFGYDDYVGSIDNPIIYP